MKAEQRLLGQNFTSAESNLLASVKHSGLIVLVCSCHVTSSAGGYFVTEMVRRLGTVTSQVFALYMHFLTIRQEKDEYSPLAHITWRSLQNG